MTRQEMMPRNARHELLHIPVKSKWLVQADNVEVEEVEKRVDALSAEEQHAAVLADAPELEALLADLQASLADVRTRVGPLVREVWLAPPSKSCCVYQQQMGFTQCGQLWCEASEGFAKCLETN